MRVVAPVVAFLLAIPFAAGAQQQWNWTEHAYPDDGFRVEFSGPVTIKRLKVDADASSLMVRGTQYMQDGETYLYVVGASLNKFGTQLDVGAEKSFAGLDCRRRTANRPFEAPSGHARELRGADCIDGSYEAVARYYQSGAWFYQVIALYKGEGGDASLARYFLQSFKVTR
jgi:hypothetical protein